MTAPADQPGHRRASIAVAAGALISCAVSVVTPCRADSQGMTTQLPEVIARRAVRKCFTSLVHASGYLVPRQTAVVMFPMPGYRITEIKAKVGDKVGRGDILARATPDGPSAAPSPDKASPPTSSPPSSDVTLPASASGTILQVTAFVGMPTSPTSQPLFTIAVDGVIEAAVVVPSVHVLELKPGQSARLTTRDGEVLDAHVRSVPAAIDPASQTGTARLAVEGGETLEPSRFVLATIVARRSCGIGVPMAALRRTSDGAYVQIIKNNVIVSRAVTLGLADESESEVTAGLAEGDIIVAGAGASREGDYVKPVVADPQDGR